MLLLSSGLLLANGLRLITSSSRSPASVISGTARQQSKSLVLTWLTCTPHRGEKEPGQDVSRTVVCLLVNTVLMFVFLVNCSDLSYLTVIRQFLSVVKEG